MRPGALVSVAAVVVVVWGCGGKAGTSSGGASGSSGGASSGASGGGPGGPVDVAARCGGGHGQAEQPETAAAFSRALVGQWFTCNFFKESPFAFTAHEGIEFLEDGHWFGLNPDGNGGFARDLTGKGFGTYTFYSASVGGLVSGTDTTPSSVRGVYLHMNENILDVRIDFEVSPRRFHTFSGSDLWFVSGDPGPTEPVPYLSKEGELCDNLFLCQTGLTCAEVAVPDYRVPGGHIRLCTK